MANQLMTGMMLCCMVAITTSKPAFYNDTKSKHVYHQNTYPVNFNRQTQSHDWDWYGSLNFPTKQIRNTDFERQIQFRYPYEPLLKLFVKLFKSWRRSSINIPFLDSMYKPPPPNIYEIYNSNQF